MEQLGRNINCLPTPLLSHIPIIIIPHRANRRPIRADAGDAGVGPGSEDQMKALGGDLFRRQVGAALGWLSVSYVKTSTPSLRSTVAQHADRNWPFNLDP